jgi:hypothetical protein
VNDLERPRAGSMIPTVEIEDEAKALFAIAERHRGRLATCFRRPCSRSTFVPLRVPYLPKPLMGRDQAFFGASVFAGWEIGRPLRHEFQDVE